MSSNKVDKSKNPALNKADVSGSAYLAFMSIDYEGIFESSMKLFRNSVDAEKYIIELKQKHSSVGCTFYVRKLHCH